jgi:thymidylate synthase
MSEEIQYLQLLDRVLKTGSKKTIFSPTDKLGTIERNKYKEVDKDSKYILSVFGAMLTFDCSNGTIPIYTSKAVYYPGAFKEMLWFLTGNGNVAALHQQKVPIWNGFAYKYWLKKNNLTADKFAFEDFVNCYLNKEKFIIPVPYTDFTDYCTSQGHIDQTRWVIDTVQKTPDRKSFVVSAWNPARLYGMSEISGLESVVLAACHCEHQVVVNDGRLNLRVSIRSSDTILGLPFNVCQYGLLLHMYAKCTGFEPGTLLIHLTDAHIYSDQIENSLVQIAKKDTELKPFPTLSIVDRGQKYLTDFVYSDFKVHSYYPEESLSFPLTLVGGY